LPRTTCIENAELPLFYHHGISAEERQKRAIDALNLVGLQQRLYHTPNQLSGGQQQRVAIARALVNDPVVIFADEATGNLDTRMSYEIMGLFQDLNRQGKTIVFVTHEPDIARMSKRTITLRDGLVISDEIYEHQVDAKEELAKLPSEEN
jgi:putative ABC transport system ATP-binding protein